jgi:hypothetical protein
MIHYNGKIIRTPQDLQRLLADTESYKQFADGVETMIYEWGKRPALELLGKALFGYVDEINYDDVLPMITKAKEGKKK